MGRAVWVQGYFSPPGAKPTPCTVKISLDVYGLHENLTVEGEGAYRITVPFRPIQGLAHRARQEAMSRERALEFSTELEGSTEGWRRVEVVAWIRIGKGFEMLTLEQGRRGQISLPYHTVERLVQVQRRQTGVKLHLRLGQVKNI
ncbi:MAG: hypothetical protein ACOX0K_03510 [Oscillospiraceae bacterium]